MSHRNRHHIAEKDRAIGGHQFADLQAIKNLPIAVARLPDLDGAPCETAPVGSDPDGLGAVALSHDAGKRNRGERTGAPMLMTKLPNIPERSSCCGSLISERTRTRRVFGSTEAPIVVILPSNTRSGNAPSLTFTCCPTRNAGLSFSTTFASIHIVLMSATTKGGGGATRLHEQARGRTARCDPAVDRARHDQGRIGHASGNDAIDLGVGLAEDAHRVAARAQIAFGGLLVRNRLFQIFLRYGERLIQLAKARQIAGGQLQHTGGGDQVRTRPPADRGCRW